MLSTFATLWPVRMMCLAAARLACVLVAAASLRLLSGCHAASEAPEERQAQLGRELLARYHCGTCHTIPGVAAAQGQAAASLAAYGRRSYIAGRVANDASTLALWIADPASVVPGTLMPNMGVSADDARDMALYLGRLR